MPIRIMIENGVGFKTQTPADCISRIQELEKDYDSLVSKALNTAQLFSWEKTASETIKVYKDVLNLRCQD